MKNNKLVFYLHPIDFNNSIYQLYYHSIEIEINIWKKKENMFGEH